MNLDFVLTDCSDMACHKGVTFIVDVQVLQCCSDLPNNLGGYSAKIIVYLETETIKEINGTIADPSNGIVNFKLTATETNALTVGNYYHHIELMTSDNVYLVASGMFEVTI